MSTPAHTLKTELLANLAHALDQPHVRLANTLAPKDDAHKIPLHVTGAEFAPDQVADGDSKAAQLVLKVKDAELISAADLRRALDADFHRIRAFRQYFNLPGQFTHHDPVKVGQTLAGFMAEYSGEKLKTKGVVDDKVSLGFSQAEQDLILSAHIFDPQKSQYHTYAMNGPNAMTLHMDFPLDVPMEQITAVRKEIGERLSLVCAYMRDKIAPAYNAKAIANNEKYKDSPEKQMSVLTAEQMEALGKLSTLCTESSTPTGTQLVYHFGVSKPGKSEIHSPDDFAPNPLAGLKLDMEKFVGHAIAFGDRPDSKQQTWSASFPYLAGPAQVAFFIKQKSKAIAAVLPEAEKMKLEGTLKTLLKEDIFKDFADSHGSRKDAKVKPMLSYRANGDDIIVSVPIPAGMENKFEFFALVNQQLEAEKHHGVPATTESASVADAVTGPRADATPIAAAVSGAESKASAKPEADAIAASLPIAESAPTGIVSDSTAVTIPVAAALNTPVAESGTVSAATAMPIAEGNTAAGNVVAPTQNVTVHCHGGTNMVDSILANGPTPIRADALQTGITPEAIAAQKEVPSTLVRQ